VANEGRSQGPRRGGDNRGGKPASGSSRGGRPGSSRDSTTGGYKKDDRAGGSSYGKSSSGSSYGKSSGGSSYGKRSDGKPGDKGGFRKDDRGGRSGGKPGEKSWSRPRRDGEDRRDEPRSIDQAKYDGPPIPEEITGRELDRNVAQQLRGLPEKLAARVARHLVAAGLVIDEDPKTAYEHTLAARARAARIAIVREACGEAAYAAGEFAEALSELRAAKRMNGSQEFLPVMADCERALGRPEKALALAKNPAVGNLSQDQQAEMTIVEAGARRDLGELDAALRTLENAPLRSQARADWVVRLRYAYADTLLAAGRTEDALVWFHRTVGIDGDEITDAADRVEELEAAADEKPQG